MSVSRMPIVPEPLAAVRVNADRHARFQSCYLRHFYPNLALVHPLAIRLDVRQKPTDRFWASAPWMLIAPEQVNAATMDALPPAVHLWVTSELNAWR